MNMMGTEHQGTADLQGLRASLEAARRDAVLAAAAADPGSGDHFERIAHLQMALMAVREEIEAHLPKMGFGSETP